MGICNLQQSSQQAEDALSHGMEALQQSLVETLSSNSLSPAGSGNVSDYMGQIAIAMGKLATLENFLHQVTSSSVRLVSSTSRELRNEWKAPPDNSVNVATANSTQVHLQPPPLGDYMRSLVLPIMSSIGNNR